MVQSLGDATDLKQVQNGFIYSSYQPSRPTFQNSGQQQKQQQQQ